MVSNAKCASSSSMRLSTQKEGPILVYTAALSLRSFNFARLRSLSHRIFHSPAVRMFRLKAMGSTASFSAAAMLMLLTISFWFRAEPPNEPLADHRNITGDRVARPNRIPKIPRCARAGRAQSFIILFVGHSGSTALISALGKHPDVHVATGKVSYYEPVDHGSLKLDYGRALQVVDAFFNSTRARGIIGGLKLQPYHILARPEAWAALFRRHDTRIIWNFRGNVFKQAVGEYDLLVHARKTRWSGLNHKRATQRTPKFRIEHMQALHKILLFRRNCAQDVESVLMGPTGGQCVLPLSYESFLHNPEMDIVRMQKFLGLWVFPGAQTSRFKVGSDNLCETVANWDDVCSAFYGCHEWRGMIEDDRNGCSCADMDTGTRDERRRFCFKDGEEKVRHTCSRLAPFMEYLQKFAPQASMERLYPKRRRVGSTRK